MTHRMPAQPPTPAHDDLVERLLPIVGQWCRRLAVPGVDAESATHDVMLVVMRRRAELRPGAPPEAWAWGITTHVLRNARRRAWLRRWLPAIAADVAGDDDPARTTEARRTALLVRGILAALKDDHRDVLVLCDVEERSRAEVAEILGVPEGTVKSRLRLAREAFRVEADRRGVPFVHLMEGDDA